MRYTSQFPPPYTISPSSSHKSTIIALHGLSSTGKIFADRLILSTDNTAPTSDNAAPSFQPWLDRLPLQHIRFVFPTAPTRHLKIPCDRDVPAWYQVSSFTDLEMNQEEQMEGLSESVSFLRDLVSEEIERLVKEGRSSTDLFLLGRSQGSSVVGWTLMTSLRNLELGGVVLAGSWLIFARSLSAVLRESSGSEGEKFVADADQQLISPSALDFVRGMFRSVSQGEERRIRKVPVLMGHGTDDQWIHIELGRQFREVLRIAGYQPDWREYEGAEDDGHWLKAPEEFDVIADFMLKKMSTG